MLDKKEGMQNLTSAVRLLDSLMASEYGIEQLDRLVRKLESLLRVQDNFQLLTLSQAVRLTRVFAYSQQVNLHKHRILEKLVKHIDSRLNELEENDAINLLRAYTYIEGDVPGSTRLFNKLN